MCGIAGFCNFSKNLLHEKEENNKIVSQMGRLLTHRGPDDFGTYVAEHIAFSHARLAVIDPKNGKQPMRRTVNGYNYVIVYNGELYNTDVIKKGLVEKGYKFYTNSDTEVLLVAYIEYGEKCGEYLNGIYSFAVWDSFRKSCFLCRDRFGVKPLFYTSSDNLFAFASEIKALFKYPTIKPKLNDYSLCEIFGLGPARSPGCGVFDNIHELPPGYCATVDYSGIKLRPYWQLEAKLHTDSYEETVEKTRDLLFNSIQNQLISDVPLCTLLSGGLDSSVVSAVAARAMKSRGKILDTYSFDYCDNSKFFKASSFQPAEDRPFVDIMVKAIGSNHRYLECGYEDLYKSLYTAVCAKDLPGMADVDSSMYYFCHQIKNNHTVCLSGECADEIFGGYPWFRDSEIYKTRAFPWSKNLDVRKEVISRDLLKKLPLDEYVRCQYEKTMSKVPYLEGENEVKRRQREIAYLNITWFMTTLLDRKDRMTMASGLEVRVPFADHNLIEYVYNVPWEYKYHNQTVKGLLIDVARDILPGEILNRKKSPYPKSYNPMYENLLKKELNDILSDSDSPILPYINIKAIKAQMNMTSDYGKPWFGQLMATPQMYAYLIQINYWMKLYNLTID